MSDGEREQMAAEETPEQKKKLSVPHIVLIGVGVVVALFFAGLITWMCIGAKIEKEQEDKTKSEKKAENGAVKAEHAAVFVDGRCVVDLPVLKRDGQDDVKPSLVLIGVKPGKFVMSEFPVCTNKDDVREIPHEVVLTEEFYIGRTEVTQEQWKALMGVKDNGAEKGKAKKSYYSFGWGSVYKNGSDDLPVDTVSWDEAMKFCETLNTSGFAPDGWMFTLPTEEQWEFAARGGVAGKGYKYSGGNDLDKVAWCKSNNGRSDVRKSSDEKCEKNRPVGQKQPNELGICDMSGNVWEWCLDHWKGDDSKSFRAIRGGCWYTEGANCLVTVRSSMSWDARAPYLGFRVALVKRPAVKEPSVKKPAHKVPAAKTEAKPAAGPVLKPAAKPEAKPAK